MIRPRNCALRPDWSLTTEAIWAVNVAFGTAVPSTETDPVTSDVRPTAVVF
jgi:hypothetical protein